jgi:hypothetical protein
MATYYINADSGNDSTGSGTAVAPWKTLSKANTSATNGDTIIFQAAVAHYTWATITLNTGMTLTGPTPTAAGFGAILDGAATVVAFAFQQGTFNNLRFTNVAQSTASALFNSVAGYTSIFNFCQFDNMSYFVAVAGTATMFYSSGIAGFAFNFCSFYNISVNAVSTGSNTGPFRGNNGIFTVTMTGCSWYFQSGHGMSCFDWSGAFAYTMVNCIFQNAGTAFTTWIHFSGPATVPTYSCFKNLSGLSGLTLTGTGTITSDPLFVNPVSGNLNLQPTSPCIGAGTMI